MIPLDRIFRKIAVGASLSLSIRIAGVGLMFAAHAMLARGLGDHDYGQFAYAISLVPVLALLAKSGFQFSGLRFLHQYGDAGQAELRAGYLRRSLQIPLLISVLLVVVVMSAGALLPDLPEAVRQAARYAAWIVVFMALATIAQQSLRAMKKIVWSQIFEQIGLPLALIAFAGGCLLTGSTPDYRDALMVYGGAFVGIALLAWWLAIKFSGIGWRTPARFETARWMRVAMPLAVVGVCTVLVSRLDIILLGFFVDADEIAFYSVSSRIAGLAVFSLAALSAITGPYLSEYLHADRHDELRHLLRRVVGAGVIINILLWLALALFGDYLLLAFGPQYVAYKPIMLILAAGRLCDLGLGIGGQLLSISGHQREFMWLLVATTLALLLSMLMVIPSHGIFGAAIATSLLLAATNLGVFLLIRRCLGINVFSRN